MKEIAEYLIELQSTVRTEDQETANAIESFQQAAQYLERELESIEQQLAELQQNIETYHDKLERFEYLLHAVFTYDKAIEQYWLYMYDWEKKQWLKYSDDSVREVDEKEVIRDTTSEHEIPYYLVYVDAQKIHELVRIVN
jgi:predicted  nucleic acid-binding Zn-ribbon protein